MFGIDPQILMFMGLAAVAAGALIYGIYYNAITSEKKTAERMKSLQVDSKTKANVRAKATDDKQRRKMREETLKSLDSQRAAGKKAANPDMAMRLTQSGLTIGLKKFYILSAMLGVVSFLLLYVVGAPIYIAAGGAFALGFGLPRWIVNYIRAKRFKAFIIVFPNAIDVIVRGVRSGLPLNDCLRIIANDSDEPVRTEFRKLVEATQVGITVPDACGRLYESVPTSETNFFAIVIAIQSQAGGNLSEALGNLSKVLRERRKMSDKIRAVSTEAKTSAIIIGSLPFAVAFMVWLSSPNYLVPLYSTSGGHKTLVVCATMMIVGIGIMKKMINFKF